MSGFTLATLLDPIATESFFDRHWERNYLHLARNNPDYYHELLSAANIDETISEGDGRYPAIRLAKGGAFFPAEAYTRNVHYGDDDFNGVPDVEKIFTEYLSGATVTLPALHRTWPPLGRLCFELENQLNHVVHTNAYVTPANAAGFTAHYDTHEVFILQIAGTKRWQIFSPPLQLPHRTQTFAPERHANAAPLAELNLSAGDLLYLPRGYIHSTSTSDSFSAHVTVGITVYTWVELAAELLQSCIADPRFRRALPAGFANTKDAKQPLASELKELIASWLGTVDVDPILASFIQRVRTARGRAPGTFRADVSAIGPKTLLRISEERQYSLAEETDGLILVIDERRVRLPLAVRPTLEAICARRAFSPERLPGIVSLDAKLALVRYLYGLGFLVLSQPNSPASQ
jgi:hypothetical protein